MSHKVWTEGGINNSINLLLQYLNSYTLKKEMDIYFLTKNIFPLAQTKRVEIWSCMLTILEIFDVCWSVTVRRYQSLWYTPINSSFTFNIHFTIQIWNLYQFVSSNIYVFSTPSTILLLEACFICWSRLVSQEIAWWWLTYQPFQTRTSCSHFY